MTPPSLGEQKLAVSPSLGPNGGSTGSVRSSGVWPSFQREEENGSMCGECEVFKAQHRDKHQYTAVILTVVIDLCDPHLQEM